MVHSVSCRLLRFCPAIVTAHYIHFILELNRFESLSSYLVKIEIERTFRNSVAISILLTTSKSNDCKFTIQTELIYEMTDRHHHNYTNSLSRFDLKSYYRPIENIDYYLILQETVDTTSAVTTVGVVNRTVQQRSPASKLARLARLAEAKLGRPTNKKRWGTLVEAAKTAKVSKMASKSRSDESLSSGNEGEQEQEPLQDDDRSPDECAAQDSQELENRISVAGILRSNSGSGGLSLDPAALAARHLTEKFRTRRPPKTSVSFDENNPSDNNTVENQESSLDHLMESTYELGGVACSSTTESRSVSPSLAVSESCEPLMLYHNRSITNQKPTEYSLSPSASVPPSDIRSIGRPANGSLQASHLPGVQPINRQMSGGWL